MSDKRDDPTIHGKSPVNAEGTRPALAEIWHHPVDTVYGRDHEVTEHP
jgi:hypothetical protein